MSSKRIADLMLEQLADYGVKYLFGVIGDAIFPLADALSRQNRIQFIPTTIETAAAFMACYSAKLTGKLGVCIGTSGPGAINLANGTAEAFLDGAPLLCISGQVSSSKMGTATKQYLEQNLFFKAITSETELCSHPDSILPILVSLINKALALRTAVHLSIPVDILNLETTAVPILPMPIQNNFDGTQTINGDFEKALELIKTCQRPLIIIGLEARKQANLLLSFAESLGAGIVTGQENKGAIPDDHSLVLGGIGEAYLPEVFTTSDLILLFGNAVYEESYLPEQTQVIQFKNSFDPNYRKYLCLNCDWDFIIAKIRENFPTVMQRDEWRSQLQLAHQARIDLLENQTQPQHPLYFFRMLSRYLADDALITLDVGEFVYWFDLGFSAKKQRVLLSSQWRSMGGGIPAGIAACLHSPGKQVVSIVGDGGFLMSGMELATLKRNHLPLTIFVLRNNCFGLEQQKMARQNFSSFGTDLVLPDLIKLAEAFGLKTISLTEPSQYGSLIAEALENSPALVEVQVSSEILPALQ